MDRKYVTERLAPDSTGIARTAQILRDGGLVTATDVNGQKFRTPSLPIELDGQSLGADLIVPELGQHTADVLAELDVQKGAGDD